MKNDIPREKRLIVFASGSKDGGGSGFEKLVEARNTGLLGAEIVAVVSNHEHGGVRKKADRLKIPFLFMDAPYTKEKYREILKTTRAEFVSLSGWLKLVSGLDPRRTINIHPGPLPRFGGKGLYGHHVHEAVMEAYKKGEVTHSAVTMHFVTERYDEGPVFFRQPVEIFPDDTPKTLGKRVNLEEHKWQPIMTNRVISGKIHWDGHDKYSLSGAIINKK